jgi:hypothetical protein
VRTVQRYERELRLPVRRPAGKPRGSVVVTRAEIDAWIAASPIREAFRLSKPAPEFTPLAQTIRAGVDEMHRLREQMIALRNEVHYSIEALHQSLVNLHLYADAPYRTRLMGRRSAMLGDDAGDLIDSDVKPVGYDKAS